MFTLIISLAMIALGCFLFSRLPRDTAGRLIILFVCWAVLAFNWYHAVWLYHFPSVFDGTYVAVYENGHVVERPYGTYDPNAFSVETREFRASYLNYSDGVGGGLLVYVEITNPDTFYSDPLARNSEQAGMKKYRTIIQGALLEGQGAALAESRQQAVSICNGKGCADNVLQVRLSAVQKFLQENGDLPFAVTGIFFSE